MHTRLRALLAIVAASAVVSACGGGYRPSGRAPRTAAAPAAKARPASLDPSTLTRLRELAIRTAVWMEDPRPDSARAYRTTRSTANRAASAAVVDSDQPVYLIVLHGHFTWRGMPKPASHLPDTTGDTLRIVWDPAADTVTDVGVGNNEPDSELLGAGFPLELP